MKNLVFTEQSILAFVENLSEEDFNSQNFKNNSNYISIEYDDFLLFLTTNKKDSDIDSIPFIIFDGNIFSQIKKLDSLQELLYTIHRTVTIILQHKGTSFSSPSVLYTNKNKLVLKAFEKKHLFMLMNANKTKNFHIFKITDPDENIEEIHINSDICIKCDSLRPEIEAKFKDELESREIKEFGFNYNLNTVFNDNAQAAYTFSQWVSLLSKRQQAFFYDDDTRSLKLTGPAGTGKTLVMTLKAIKILQNNNSARVLFTCHSWSVACQVSDFIDSVAPEFSNKIVISPLLELAKEHVALKNKEIIKLGNDSYEGKYGQIIILSEIIQDFVLTDWIAYKNQCTKDFVTLIEEVSYTNNNFTWNLMNEISCVIGANGIMPGKNSLEKYKKIKRYSWMIHLANDAEKAVVFSIYEKYMNYLRVKKNYTSDQVTNDYINYLSTYNWYYERTTEGFDYIFVDEMQLFNDQERMALVYLSRNPDDYPRIIMALDPKQSIDEVYSDLGITEILNKSNPNTDKSMGKTTSFSLDIAYRYTKEILNFLKHIDAYYPQMELGHEWNNKISGLKAGKMKNGNLPILYTYNNKIDEVKYAIQTAEQLTNSGKQTIILSLQDDLFDMLQNEVKDNTRFNLILSKKDVALLKYTKKKILISEPNYVIGLQFDAVILIGCYSIYEKYENNKSYYQRRFLSDLYLGASRAKTDLILTKNNELADFPEFLESAIKNKLVFEDKMIK